MFFPCKMRNAHLEAATRNVLYKKLFLKNSQHSQEKTCVGIFSYEYCEILKNTYFKEHLRMVLSAHATAKAYLEPYQTSMMNLFCENSCQVKAANFFWKKTLSLMSGRVLNTPFDSRNTCPEHTFRFTINC